MVEYYMKREDMEKLNGILPLYVKKRTKGMNAGNISEQTGIPLKDVMSFLIERNILNGEQVDLELARVMISRNMDLRENILAKTNTTFKKLDLALAAQDSQKLREIGGQSEFQQAFSIIPQFMVFGSILQMPFNLTMSLCLALAGFLIMQVLQKYNPKSNIEIVTKILEGC